MNRRRFLGSLIAFAGGWSGLGGTATAEGRVAWKVYTCSIVLNENWIAGVSLPPVTNGCEIIVHCEGKVPLKIYPSGFVPCSDYKGGTQVPYKIGHHKTLI